MTEKRVPPYGPESAEIAFVGQSPGKTEGQKGRPFCGKAGQLLRELCHMAGIDPERCYWTNICDRVLLGSDEPEPDDIAAGQKRLRVELGALTRLKTVVLVGKWAAQVVFNGTMGEMSGDDGYLFGTPCTAIFHPSAALRAGREDSENIKAEIVRVLRDVHKASPTLVRPRRKSLVLRALKPVKREIEEDDEPISEDWLRILMDETLERQQPLWHEPRPYFRGSEVGDPCLRSLVLSAMGHNMPVEARLRRIFNTGISIEDSNVTTLTTAGVMTRPDTQPEAIYEDPPIVGHVDAIILRPRDGAQVLGEIKSIKEELFKRLAAEHGLTLASKSPLMKTHRNYVLQWNTYACAPNINLDEGFILFESKNTQKQKFFWLRKDEALMEEVKARLRLAAPYLAEMRVPPIDLEPDEDPTHKSCPRRYLCTRIPNEGAGYEEVRKIDAGVRG